MNNGQFSESIANYTADHSNFDTRRDYISLSHIHLSVDEIVYQHKSGFEDTRDIRLKCYKGYQMEKDLMSRIIAVYPPRIRQDIEISAFNGMVKGHPDFTFDGDPGDCKSVLLDEWFPKDGKLPKRIYWQMQAYMKYMNKNKAIVIFESRESGKLVDYWIKENRTIQSEIDNKLKEVIKLIKL